MSNNVLQQMVEIVRSQNEPGAMLAKLAAGPVAKRLNCTQEEVEAVKAAAAETLTINPKLAKLPVEKWSDNVWGMFLERVAPRLPQAPVTETDNSLSLFEEEASQPAASAAPTSTTANGHSEGRRERLPEEVYELIRDAVYGSAKAAQSGDKEGLGDYQIRDGLGDLVRDVRKEFGDDPSTWDFDKLDQFVAKTMREGNKYGQAVKAVELEARRRNYQTAPAPQPGKPLVETDRKAGMIGNDSFSSLVSMVMSGTPVERAFDARGLKARGEKPPSRSKAPAPEESLFEEIGDLA